MKLFQKMFSLATILAKVANVLTFLHCILSIPIFGGNTLPFITFILNYGTGNAVVLQIQALKNGISKETTD